MKLVQLQKPKKAGQVTTNGVKLEPEEIQTIAYLAQFGFDIELVKPVATKHSNNPDLLMLGAAWEKHGSDTVEKQLLELIEARGRVKKMIIIRKNGEVLDVAA